MERYHFVGIGGIGMSGLAQILAHRGICVSGSDRSNDRGESGELFKKLKGLGVKLYPQNGSAIKGAIDRIIISRAVEDDNPDLLRAKKKNIPVIYRQDELKRIFRENPGIAVAGTSGKTTVVGMIGSVFQGAGRDITVLNGGYVKNFETGKYPGNARIGKFPFSCFETDESEGDLTGYFPEIGVINNIGYDHMDHKKTMKVYKDFAREARGVLVVKKDVRTHFNNKNMITFSIGQKADFSARDARLYPEHSVFKVNGRKIKLNAPGTHNIYNAVAAVAVSNVWGIPMSEIADGMESFKGIKRRFELLKTRKGIRVVDDYAHNPDKIKAALNTAHIGHNRVIAVYQPHGYAPTKMFLKELADAFARNLKKHDLLFIPDIYYAGGRVRKDISSGDLINEIKKRNKLLGVEYIKDREDVKARIRKIAREGDIILVMGARDTTLPSWAEEILQ